MSPWSLQARNLRPVRGLCRGSSVGRGGAHLLLCSAPWPWKIRENPSVFMGKSPSYSWGTFQHAIFDERVNLRGKKSWDNQLRKFPKFYCVWKCFFFWTARDTSPSSSNQPDRWRKPPKFANVDLIPSIASQDQHVAGLDRVAGGPSGESLDHDPMRSHDIPWTSHRFTWQARQAQRLDPVENMQSRVPVKLQAERREGFSWDQLRKTIYNHP